MFRFALCLTATIGLAQPVLARDASELFDTMKMPELLEVMQQEGINYGEEIGSDLFGGPPNGEWIAVVARIYDLETMDSYARSDFEAALEGVDLDPMFDFFGSERGQEIVMLEISARRAFLDDAVEEAAKDSAARAMEEDTPRHQLIDEFVQVNDLVETNVVGALNSNFAFYMGLTDGGAFGGDITEDQILADIWGQEPEIRQNTTEWVYGFLTMAYQPLEDVDIEAYIAFSKTEEGQALNRALFAAFDGLFEDISRALGLAAADQMTAQEL